MIFIDFILATPVFLQYSLLDYGAIRGNARKHETRIYNSKEQDKTGQTIASQNNTYHTANTIPIHRQGKTKTMQQHATLDIVLDFQML